jgi:hypothetical protein
MEERKVSYQTTRGVYDWKGSRTIEITLWWWRWDRSYWRTRVHEAELDSPSEAHLRRGSSGEVSRYVWIFLVRVSNTSANVNQVTVKGVQDTSADRYIYAARQVGRDQKFEVLITLSPLNGRILVDST